MTVDYSHPKKVFADVLLVLLDGAFNVVASGIEFEYGSDGKDEETAARRRGSEVAAAVEDPYVGTQAMNLTIVDLTIENPEGCTSLNIITSFEIAMGIVCNSAVRSSTRAGIFGDGIRSQR